MSLVSAAVHFLLGHPRLIDFLVGSLPLVLLALLLHHCRQHREGQLEVLTAFSLGLLATLPVTMLAMPGGLRAPGAWGSAHSAFVDAAFIEESCKFLAMLWLASRTKDFRPLSLLISGLFLGLGFASMENLLFFSRGIDGMIFRTFSTAPCHAFLGAIMASYFARFRVERRWTSLAKAWVLPFLLHGLYDFPLMMVTSSVLQDLSNGLLSALVLALLAAWTRFLLTSFARVKPVEVGTVTERQEVASSARDGVDAA